MLLPVDLEVAIPLSEIADLRELLTDLARHMELREEASALLHGSTRRRSNLSTRVDNQLAQVVEWMQILPTEGE